MRIFGRIINADGVKHWGVDYMDPQTGKRIRKLISPNKKQAEAVLAKIRTSILETGYFETNKIKNRSFVDASAEYLKFVKQSKKSYTSDEFTLRTFGAFSSESTGNKPISELLLSEITTKATEDFKLFRSRGKEKATVNRALAVLKHFFNCCIEWGYTDENPVRKVKLYKLSDGKTRFLENDEIEALLLACDKADTRAKHLKPIVVIALNTGMRRGEILGMKWKDIDSKRGIIYTGITKNGERLKKQMNSNVSRALEGLTAFRDKGDKFYIDEYVFRNKDAKPIIDIKRSFHTALAVAGIENASFHTLRHTFASHLMMKTGNIMMVKEALGHNTLKMTERYSHLSPGYKQKAIEDLYEKKDGTNMAQNEVNENKVKADY